MHYKTIQYLISTNQVDPAKKTTFVKTGISSKTKTMAIFVVCNKSAMLEIWYVYNVLYEIDFKITKKLIELGHTSCNAIGR